ncbi:MAG: alpha/beta hydrolase [Leptolyngbya sp. SIO4C1]|nr:alpha/beta hydrolase [Leptolyngbya sp. SIO4C1]
MNGVPFRIQKFSVNPDTEAIEVGSVSGQQMPQIPSYFVKSTAPPNIEDAAQLSIQEEERTRRGVSAIAQDLYRIYRDPTITEAPELVITIHGYNTHERGIKSWYGDMVRYINQGDEAIRHKRNAVFIGYRWSSENFSIAPKHLWANLRALPSAPKLLLKLGGFFSIACLIAGFVIADDRIDFGLGLLLGLAASTAAIVIALVLLRLSVYFRDVYRATNFGVLDLVELIRMLDRAIINQTAADLDRTVPNRSQAAREHWETSSQRIRLNFVGHSMGALVVTNVVRILSDVFDQRSIAKSPVPEIGRTFSLERLVLVAPDIPILSIISSRANFLASSLRRFNEAYLFSSEGDLALRFASTAVNYISFPSATRTRGYRLGNVALRETEEYGIVNLASLRQYFGAEVGLQRAIADDPDDILKNLYVTHSGKQPDGYLSLAELFSQQDKIAAASATLADLFTFFDCTDYHDTCVCFAGSDREPQRMGILSRSRRKKLLGVWDYIELAFDSVRKQRDVHGGYFHGEFSRQLIYRLAFLGFEGVLKATPAASPQAALDTLNEQCRDVLIQAYVSPLHYRVGVQGQPVTEAKAELLKKIKTEA